MPGEAQSIGVRTVTLNGAADMASARRLHAAIVRSVRILDADAGDFSVHLVVEEPSEGGDLRERCD